MTKKINSTHLNGDNATKNMWHLYVACSIIETTSYFIMKSTNGRCEGDFEMGDSDTFHTSTQFWVIIFNHSIFQQHVTRLLIKT